MTTNDYWKECISIAADECGATLTPEQLNYIVDAVQGSHENYGMAFYSPPASDRLNDIEREYKTKICSLQTEMLQYRTKAETAIKQALNQNCDANVSIGEYGEVYRHGGRTEQIQ